MKHKAAILVAFLVMLIATSVGRVNAEPPKKAKNVKLDPALLVAKIEKASLEELSKLKFHELYLLKNAVFASKGYDFASDRRWLDSFFCPAPYFYNGENIEDDTDVVWFKKNYGAKNTWDLGNYYFPECQGGKELDKHQVQALANIRVATFMKVKSFKSTQALDAALNKEFNNIPNKVDWLWVMGRSIVVGNDRGTEDVRPAWLSSLKRDMHGYAKILSLAGSSKDLDPMELLGLYVGDISLLKSILEAKHGKPLSGVLGWEVGKIVGMTEQDPSYDPSRLPPAIQVKLSIMDEAIKKIQQSDLQDLPKELKKSPVDLIDAYSWGAC